MTDWISDKDLFVIEQVCCAVQDCAIELGERPRLAARIAFVVWAYLGELAAHGALDWSDEGGVRHACSMAAHCHHVRTARCKSIGDAAVVAMRQAISTFDSQGLHNAALLI